MSKLKRLLRYDWPLHFVLLFTNWFPDNVVLIRLRGRLASPFFKKCGKRLGLGRNITFYDPSKIEIGNDVYIAYGCWFYGNEKIDIQDNAIFGPYVVVVTANHSYAEGSYRNGPHVDVKPVQIGAGSWIAAHCTILPGAQIAEATVIAANSVFKGTTTPGGIYGGVPAHKLREIEL